MKTLTVDEKIKADSLGRSMVRYGLAGGAILLILSIVLGGTEHDHFQRFQYGALTAWMFVFTLCLGSLFIVMIHHLVRAKWDTVLLRIAENVASAFPLVAALGLIVMAPMFLGNHHLYFWDSWHQLPKDLQHDEAFKILQKKGTWLSSGAFILRYALYMALYSGMALYFARQSRREDETGDRKIGERLRIAAGPLVLLYALTTVMAGFDLTMSLSPEWYSSIYPVNLFGGAMCGTWAFLTLLTRAIQRTGKLTNVVTREHYHDTGKWVFAFNFFWAYTAFSPLLLIWYSNIPEEVVWYRYRWAGTDWQALTYVVIFAVWVFPYVALLSRWTKRILPLLMLVCFEQLVAHYIDLYWNVMPNVNWGHREDGLVTGPLTGPFTQHGWHFAASDLLSLLAFFALFLAAVGTRMKGNLVPIKNRTLNASMAFENY